MTNTTNAAPPFSDKSPRLNPRVIGMLILFTLIISASVIATDILSPRPRHLTTTTLPATAP